MFVRGWKEREREQKTDRWGKIEREKERKIDRCGTLRKRGRGRERAK